MNEKAGWGGNVLHHDVVEHAEILLARDTQVRVLVVLDLQRR